MSVCQSSRVGGRERSVPVRLDSGHISTTLIYTSLHINIKKFYYFLIFFNNFWTSSGAYLTPIKNPIEVHHSFSLTTSRRSIVGLWTFIVIPATSCAPALSEHGWMECSLLLLYTHLIQFSVFTYRPSYSHLFHPWKPVLNIYTF